MKTLHAVFIWFSENFTKGWIKKLGTVEWALRFPGLNLMDFAVRGYLKLRVYSAELYRYGTSETTISR
jgi:hypothetical protein